MAKNVLVPLLIVSCAGFACARSCQSDNAENKTSSSPQNALLASGRAAYMANCIACHNPDPKIDGSIGPAVHGASLELLTTRIVHAEYPQGYTPKRATNLMVKMPHLEKNISALHAFLNQ